MVNSLKNEKLFLFTNMNKERDYFFRKSMNQNKVLVNIDFRKLHNFRKKYTY